MSAARRPSACAGWRRRSASASARRRSSPASRRPTAGWSTPREAMRLFGYPSVPLARLIDWTADWVARGMPSLGKDTHYDTRDGQLLISSLDDQAALSAAELRRRRRAGARGQLEPDRRRLAHLPRARHASMRCTTDAGRIVATAATLPYGGRFAWISMVLVAGDYRRRGLATQLMRRASTISPPPAWCRCSTPRRTAARSIARSASRTRGASSGCVRRERAARRRDVAAPDGVAIRAIADADWPALCAYDAAAFGADRSAVLARPARTAAGGRAGRRARRPHRRLPARPRRPAGGAARPADRRRRRDRARAAGARARCARRARSSSISPTPRRAARLARSARLRARSGRSRACCYGAPQRFDDAARTFAVVGPEFG